MRRAATAAVVAAAAAAVAVLIALNAGGGGGSYRLAAIFDDGEGMVSGQQVKIAGAVVGDVTAVKLAPGPKARLVLSIQRRFAPFRANATCSILPEGLISENYVDCNPGSARTPLQSARGDLPTVPLTNTTDPVSLQDVLNVFSVPTDQRLGLLMDELGIATSGRGEDINGLLRRSNPTLQQAQRAVQVLNSERDQLAASITQTDDVLGTLDTNSQSVRAFVDRAASVAGTTAAHQAALSADIARLPAMLVASRTGLQSIDSAVRNATPALTGLRESAPGLLELSDTLPSFTSAGVPAARTLQTATAAGADALRDAEPVIAILRDTVSPLKTAGSEIDKFLVSLRSTGGFEGLLRFTYAFATSLAPEDGLGHFLTILAGARPDCIVAEQADLPDFGCGKSFSSPANGELPVNDPSCGPKSGSWYNEVCPGSVPSPVALIKQPDASSLYAKIGKLVDQALTAHPPSQSQFISLMKELTGGLASTVCSVTAALKVNGCPAAHPTTPGHATTNPTAGPTATTTHPTTTTVAPPSGTTGLTGLIGVVGKTLGSVTGSTAPGTSSVAHALQGLLGYLLK